MNSKQEQQKRDERVVREGLIRFQESRKRESLKRKSRTTAICNLCDGQHFSSDCPNPPAVEVIWQRVQNKPLCPLCLGYRNHTIFRCIKFAPHQTEPKEGRQARFDDPYWLRVQYNTYQNTCCKAACLADGVVHHPFLCRMTPGQSLDATPRGYSRPRSSTDKK